MIVRRLMFGKHHLGLLIFHALPVRWPLGSLLGVRSAGTEQGWAGRLGFFWGVLVGMAGVWWRVLRRGLAAGIVGCGRVFSVDASLLWVAGRQGGLLRRECHHGRADCFALDCQDSSGGSGLLWGVRAALGGSGLPWGVRPAERGCRGAQGGASSCGAVPALEEDGGPPGAAPLC
jgi:hypothetical protein